MLRELVKHLGGTQPRCHDVDARSTAGEMAPGDAPSGSGKAGQKTLRLENSPHRDWRPRLYW